MTENYSTTDLPGLQSCCLDEWVLKIVAIGLRNRKNERYTSMYEQGHCEVSVLERCIISSIWIALFNFPCREIFSCFL